MLLITGGGTGGHLSIVKALCEECNKNGLKPIYIGSNNGQDRKWFEDHDGFLDAYFLDSSGVVNKSGFNKILSLINIFKQSFLCWKIFRKHGIKNVISVGGYSAAPASLAAIFLRKDFFIHEQNAVLGRLNKLLKPFAKELFSSFENATFHTSYPISQAFFETQRIRKDIKTIIFLGGSQGASFINVLAKEMAQGLKERNINIIHQCGKNDFESLDLFYKKHGIKVDLFEFDKNLHVKMQRADFAISRAGASSLWEIVANALPAFFIPFPYAAADHQYFNAKFLLDKKLAFLCRQDRVKKEDIFKLLDQLDNLKEISSKLALWSQKNGAEQIIKEVGATI
ncbi:MAG: UDP-N-acetylglucosamine--N-acetylmuramyl-(pentapeptide) pyrophosphoryl-undecaprenol N-acetylglucosamine transferase [Proteobacteria bacterium]|nr:MAG: UDP-N-acetylglucosamine--N-acetylmuramyl-(pentapeptide) pyrophosphoryl-undecaprenol N-acetylglucosamine transferase [Pseudomonadota bacterium]